VTDLFSRVSVGTKVVVLPKNAAHLAARSIAGGEVASVMPQPRAEVTTLPSGRRAVNLSMSSLY